MTLVAVRHPPDERSVERQPKQSADIEKQVNPLFGEEERGQQREQYHADRQRKRRHGERCPPHVHESTLEETEPFVGEAISQQQQVARTNAEHNTGEHEKRRNMIEKTGGHHAERTGKGERHGEIVFAQKHSANAHRLRPQPIKEVSLHGKGNLQINQSKAHGGKWHNGKQLRIAGRGVIGEIEIGLQHDQKGQNKLRTQPTGTTERPKLHGIERAHTRAADVANAPPQLVVALELAQICHDKTESKDAQRNEEGQMHMPRQHKGIEAPDQHEDEPKRKSQHHGQLKTPTIRLAQSGNDQTIDKRHTEENKPTQQRLHRRKNQEDCHRGRQRPVEIPKIQNIGKEDEAIPRSRSDGARVDVSIGQCRVALKKQLHEDIDGKNEGCHHGHDFLPRHTSLQLANSQSRIEKSCHAQQCADHIDIQCHEERAPTKVASFPNEPQSDEQFQHIIISPLAKSLLPPPCCSAKIRKGGQFPYPAKVIKANKRNKPFPLIFRVTGKNCESADIESHQLAWLSPLLCCEYPEQWYQHQDRRQLIRA